MDAITKFNQFHEADKIIQDQFSLQTKNFRDRIRKRKNKAMNQVSLIEEDISQQNEKNITDSQISTEMDLDKSLISNEDILNSSILNSKTENSLKNNLQTKDSSADIKKSEFFTTDLEESSKTVPSFVSSEYVIDTEHAKSYLEAHDYLEKIEASMNERMLLGESHLNISDDKIELIDEQTKEQFIKNYEKYQSNQGVDHDDEKDEQNRIYIEENDNEALLFQKNEKINSNDINFQDEIMDSLQSELLLNSCDVFINNQQQKIVNELKNNKNESEHLLLLPNANNDTPQNNYFIKQNKIEKSEIDTDSVPTEYQNLPNCSQKSIEKSKNNLISAINIQISGSEFEYENNDNYDELNDLTQSKETDLMASNLSYLNEEKTKKNFNYVENPQTLQNLAIKSKLIKSHRVNPSSKGFEKSTLIDQNLEHCVFEEVNDQEEFLISTIGNGMVSQEPGVIQQDYIPDSFEKISAQKFGDSLAEYQKMKEQHELTKEQEEEYKNYYLEQNYQSDMNIGNNFDDDIKISKELEKINSEMENSEVDMINSANTINLIEELNEKNKQSQNKY